METLRSKIALSLVPTEKVIAAGPLTLQPGCRPFRIVMIMWPDYQLSVHCETFEVDDPVQDLAAACAGAKSNFSDGHYYRNIDFSEAVGMFCRRVNQCTDVTELYQFRENFGNQNVP